MVKPRHLSNAPIVEALIDFRVKLPSTFEITKFLPLKEKLSADYPKFQGKRRVQFRTGVKGAQFQQTVQDEGLAGYWITSADEKNVAQFRIDGFTFSRLQPYTKWESVLAEAKRLWELYDNVASPEFITRIAVRYINQMNIPFPINDFDSYLTSPPRVPKTLPQSISDFLTRIVICDKEHDIFANVTQALQKSDKLNYVTVILDIDVYKKKEVGFDENEIWPTFQILRDLKNRIFFDSIKEKAVRLFK